jgi:hypothetical protein
VEHEPARPGADSAAVPPRPTEPAAQPDAPSAPSVTLADVAAPLDSEPAAPGAPGTPCQADRDGVVTTPGERGDPRPFAPPDPPGTTPHEPTTTHPAAPSPTTADQGISGETPASDSVFGEAPQPSASAPVPPAGEAGVQPVAGALPAAPERPADGGTVDLPTLLRSLERDEGARARRLNRLAYEAFEGGATTPEEWDRALAVQLPWWSGLPAPLRQFIFELVAADCHRVTAHSTAAGDQPPSVPAAPVTGDEPPEPVAATPAHLPAIPDGSPEPGAPAGDSPQPVEVLAPRGPGEQPAGDRLAAAWLEPGPLPMPEAPARDASGDENQRPEAPGPASAVVEGEARPGGEGLFDEQSTAAAAHHAAGATPREAAPAEGVPRPGPAATERASTIAAHAMPSAPSWFPAIGPGLPDWCTEEELRAAKELPLPGTSAVVEGGYPGVRRNVVFLALREARLNPALVEPLEAEAAYEPGPNWMLAFVSGWAGLTSLWEAWALYSAGEMGSRVQGPAVLGYTSLGLGLLGFGVEAARPTSRRGRALLASLSAPVLLTIAGILLLILSHTAGRRI